MIPGYPGGPVPSRRNFPGCRAPERRQCGKDLTAFAGFEDGAGRLWTKDCGEPPEPQKGKERA